MPTQQLLTIDFGTSGIKCMIFTANGHVLSRQFTPIQYIDSEGLSGIGKEFNSKTAWRIIQKMIPICLKEAKSVPEDIAGIATTSQRHGAVFLDKKGNVIYSGPNLDARGVLVQNLVAEKLENACPPTGCWPPLLYSLCRILWFKQHKPDLFAKIAHVLSISDWIVYKLTGEIATDPSQASNTQFMDIQTAQWSLEILELAELSNELLPPIIESGTLVGHILPSVSKSLGLSKTSVVGIGGADTQCALLGSGTVKAGEIGVVAGNTAPVQMVTNEPIIDPACRLWTGRFLLPNKWVLEANTGTTGAVLKWFVQNMIAPISEDTDGTSDYAFERVEKLAAGAPLGSLETIALLGPSIMDARNMTTVRPSLILFPPPASPLSSPITIRELSRALFENISFAIRANIELIEALAECKFDVCTVAGGLVRSRFWRQMLADVTGLRIRHSHVAEASSLGAAVCAATAAGLYGSLTDTMHRMVKLQPEIHSHTERHSKYETYFTRWQTLYKQSANL